MVPQCLREKEHTLLRFTWVSQRCVGSAGMSQDIPAHKRAGVPPPDTLLKYLEVTKGRAGVGRGVGARDKQGILYVFASKIKSPKMEAHLAFFTNPLWPLR